MIQNFGYKTIIFAENKSAERNSKMTTAEDKVLLTEISVVQEKLIEGQKAQGELLNSITDLIEKVKETAEDALRIALEAKAETPTIIIARDDRSEGE